MSYYGVYSSYNLTTHKGIEAEVKNAENNLTNLKSLQLKQSNGSRDRHIFSSESLGNANINVAKLRLYSTIPSKAVEKEVSGKAYIGFILTGVDESHSEKVELISLPGDSFASYFYGAQPRQYGFSGILLNTDQDRWRDAFEELYEKYLRGTVATRRKNIVQISYDNRVVSGWLTNLTQRVSSESDLYASFTFSMLVSRVDIISSKPESSTTTYKFEPYLTQKLGILKETNELLLGDYAILNKDNYDKLIDPVNTGVVIPPKRPHRKGRSGQAVSCYDPKKVTTAGKNSDQGTTSTSNSFFAATECTVLENLVGQRKQISKIKKALNKADKSKTTTELITNPIDPTTKTTVKALRVELQKRETAYNKYIKTSDVIDDFGKETGDSIPLNQELVVGDMVIAERENLGEPTAYKTRSRDRISAVLLEVPISSRGPNAPGYKASQKETEKPKKNKNKKNNKVYGTTRPITAKQSSNK